MTTTTIELTEEQRDAIQFVEMWMPGGLVAIKGPAGSGKTTLTRELIRTLEEEEYNVVACAPTNKAAFVLRGKGIDAITLHQACMSPIFKPPLNRLANELEVNSKLEKNHKFSEDLTKTYSFEDLLEASKMVGKTGISSALRFLGIKDSFKYLERWVPKEQAGKKSVLLIDEASMLSGIDLEMAQSVFDHVILVGDDYQLPPVKGEPVFWQVRHSFELKQIHRQAEGSQPLTIATALRRGEPVKPTPVVPIDYDLCRAGMPIIVWRNVVREKLTRDIRKKFGYDGKGPQVGEMVICRNSLDKDAKNMGLLNNTLWKVVAADGYRCSLEDVDGNVLDEIDVHMEETNCGDGIPFRWAYALTSYSSQGSEWDKVMLHVSDMRAHIRVSEEIGRKSLYTGVTRAKSEVLWIAA